MTILYDYKDSLYINMTNKCPCACVFCIRDETDHVGNSDSLWLDHEPTVEEVKNDYRNPSAHTNELRRVDAEQCFALVVDVEKLMKKMLDSFDE